MCNDSARDAMSHSSVEKCTRLDNGYLNQCEDSGSNVSGLILGCTSEIKSGRPDSIVRLRIHNTSFPSDFSLRALVVVQKGPVVQPIIKYSQVGHVLGEIDPVLHGNGSRRPSN
jgi:hypothetical protein